MSAGRTYGALKLALEAANCDLDRSFQTLELYGVPKQRAKYVSNGIEVLMTRIDRQVGDLQRHNNSLQAKIDALMLEYCPEDMTPEQLEAWGNNQRPAI